MARAWTNVQPVAKLAAMKREKDQIGTLKFIAIGVVLMILADQYVFGGKRSYIEANRTMPAIEQGADGGTVPVHPDLPPPERVEPPDGAAYFEAPETGGAPPDPDDAGGTGAAKPDTPSMEGAGAGGEALAPSGQELFADTPKAAAEEDKAVIKRSFMPHGAPKISIIIDDLGMDVRRSNEAIDLPAPVTMAFLPYAAKTPELARRAKEKGHTLIIHVPMEAMDEKNYIGPGGLKRGMGAAEFRAAFEKMLVSFEGYEGINNHMGSRLTQDKEAMARLMPMLAERGLFFVDSKTSGKSVAASEADRAGIPYAERHVFLDHEDSADFVARALKATENRALKHGYAIAIGHPKDHTLNGLRAWIPTLRQKGIELVSVKGLLLQPEGGEAGNGEGGKDAPQAVEVRLPAVKDVALPDKPALPEDALKNVELLHFQGRAGAQKKPAGDAAQGAPAPAPDPFSQGIY
ncbi:MAG: divergent polysaccharide deacetylase family protein [Micavibrio sp.]